MKTTFKIILFLCLSNLCQAQSLVGQSRRLKFPMTIAEYDYDNHKPLTDNSNKAIRQSAKALSRFTIYEENDNSYIIYFWNYSSEESKKKYNVNESNNQKYFSIPKADLFIKTQEIFKKWSPNYGVLNFPFKYRPNDGSFEKTFSLSFSGGPKFNPWWTNEHTFSVLLGCGASSVSLNQFNTDPSSKITNDTDRPAVTGSISLVYQWNNLQFGFSAGKDAIFTNRVDKWANQGKTWFSFAIGVAIFNDNKITEPGSN